MSRDLRDRTAGVDGGPDGDRDDDDDRGTDWSGGAAAVPLDGTARSATLSTGHRVALPLRCRARAGGVVLASDRDPLRAAVPEPLAPIRVAPGTGLVTLVGVTYEAVDEGSIDPYDEVGAIVPVTRAPGGLPVPSRRLGVGGYVHALPVTSEASVALGREIWGYPKRVARIDVRIDDEGRRLIVALDEHGPEPGVRLWTSARRRRLLSGTLDGYTVRDGRVVRGTVAASADVRFGVGAGPDTRLSLGAGPTADALRALGLDDDVRVVGRFVADELRAAIGPPVAVEE